MSYNEVTGIADRQMSIESVILVSFSQVIVSGTVCYCPNVTAAAATWQPVPGTN